jgi:hypothetical protein
MDGVARAADLAECEEYPSAAPWIEDEHGHVEYDDAEDNLGDAELPSRVKVKVH